jgi:hypothetical protein
LADLTTKITLRVSPCRCVPCVIAGR